MRSVSRALGAAQNSCVRAELHACVHDVILHFACAGLYRKGRLCLCRVTNRFSVRVCLRAYEVALDLHVQVCVGVRQQQSVESRRALKHMEKNTSGCAGACVCLLGHNGCFTVHISVCVSVCVCACL